MINQDGYFKQSNHSLSSTIELSGLLLLVFMGLSELLLV